MNCWQRLKTSCEFKTTCWGKFKCCSSAGEQCKKLCPPAARFWMAVLIFFGAFMNYSMRSNISVNIISMVDPPERENCVVDDLFQYKPVFPNGTSSSGKFEWNEIVQGHVLAAYFWGFVIFSILAGPVLRVMGPYFVVFYATMFSLILNTLTPLCATKGGWWGVAINRFFSGALGGLCLPGLEVLLIKWSTPEERQKFSACFLAGAASGTLVTWLIGGLINEYVHWKHAFLVFSIIGCVFCGFFCIYASDSPRTHYWISRDEQVYIQQSLEDAHFGKHISFKKMVTSLSFWILALAQFGTYWGTNVILIYAPKFISSTFSYSIGQVAMFAAIPNCFRILFTYIFIKADEHLVITRLPALSPWISKKIAIMFSHFIPAGCLLLVPHVRCSFPGVMLLLVISQIFSASIVLSHYRSSQDMHYHFAGNFYGSLNAIGHCSGFIVAHVNGVILHNSMNIPHISRGPWLIFAISGGIHAICGIVFIFIGSEKLVTWKETNL